MKKLVALAVALRFMHLVCVVLFVCGAHLNSRTGFDSLAAATALAYDSFSC